MLLKVVVIFSLENKKKLVLTSVTRKVTRSDSGHSFSNVDRNNKIHTHIMRENHYCVSVRQAPSKIDPGVGEPVGARGGRSSRIVDIVSSVGFNGGGGIRTNASARRGIISIRRMGKTRRRRRRRKKNTFIIVMIIK